MRRWIVPALSVLSWSCHSHAPVRAAVSLDRQQVKLGWVVNLRVEHAPADWSGAVYVKDSSPIPFNAENERLAINSENGFRAAGVYDLFVAINDSNGAQIPLTNRGPLRLEVSRPSVLLQPDAVVVSAAGGTGDIEVKAASDYRWAPANLPAWIQMTPASEGFGEHAGNATIGYQAGANATGQSRSAGIAIGDAILTITQLAPLSAPYTQSLDAGSGTTGAKVTLTGSTVRLNDDLQIRIDRIASPWTGQLTVNSLKHFDLTSGTYTVTASLDNGFRATGPSDLYVELVNGDNKPIPLSGKGLFKVIIQPTAVNLDPAREKLGPRPESGSFKVKASGGYKWSITGVPDWIRIDSGKTGSGSGLVRYTVLDNNTNDTRLATLTVEDAAYRITQARLDAVQIPFHDTFHYPSPPAPGYVLETGGGTPANRWNWDEQTEKSSEVALSEEGPPGSASMTVERRGADPLPWATQVFLPEINLQPGVQYVISARMKAENPGPVTFALGQRTKPYQGCGLSKAFQVTNSWTRYEAVFSVHGDGCYASNNRFLIQAGQIGGKLWVADFSIARQ